ncbi:solute carrier family 35 member G1 isoform X1 [Sceloporus undulatus]|uniref:solute carrier family 35 member G1 isoform X1 n=2 Tax=Sceloporus undulatus TaxID=8520 RepID=UPI001C4B2975|nr:solute carrier family 35 member G1 isoform X1 [Sceloporus undulatus]
MGAGRGAPLRGPGGGGRGATGAMPRPRRGGGEGEGEGEGGWQCPGARRKPRLPFMLLLPPRGLLLESPAWWVRRKEGRKEGRQPLAVGIKKKRSCPGLGLFYTLLSAFLFSVASLFLKKIEDLHSVEVSAFRCIFQMMFVLPGLIYYKTGFLGPKDKRMFLFFRGLLGSGAMILLYYAFQVMPLADATVITFSSPVFTSLFAWIFLKEKYSLWDLLFTIFTITGVVLIARPPFLFGSKVSGIEGSYTDHIKGTIAAVTSAVAAASTFVILRKVGKSVHYFLSIWYYAVIGLIVCVIALSVIGEWSLPNCGIDRFLLIAIGLLGLGGQIFLTKALQIEEAGPVAIMKTMDVVFAFILQILFLNHLPTWWTVGGALCVVASSSGTVIRKWRQNSKKSTRNEI